MYILLLLVISKQTNALHFSLYDENSRFRDFFYVCTNLKLNARYQILGNPHPLVYEKDAVAELYLTGTIAVYHVYYSTSRTLHGDF